MNRRRFMKTAAIGSLAMAAMDVVSPATTAADSTNVGAKMPRLLPGCCAYSYAEEFKNGSLTMESFIQKAVDLRVIAVDMTAYYLKSTDPEYLSQLRKLAYKHAIAFSGAACGVSMVQASAAKRADSLTEIKKWVDVTDRLGASHLRVFAGQLPAGATVQEAVGWVVETMKAACDYSGQKGITVGFEDHEGITQTADVCLEIVERVNSPYAGINLDITNFKTSPGQDAYTQIAACIPYATNIHIRDRFYDHTAVDMERVWKIFADAGHQGYVCAEYERNQPTSDSPATGVPKLVSEIRRLCRQYSSVNV